jgi:hypothetical protein
MNDQHAISYVRAAATALRIELTDDRATSVAVHLQRTAVMADLLDAFALGDAEELAEIYCPAPYRAEVT